MIASGGSFTIALSASMAAACGVASSTTALTSTALGGFYGAFGGYLSYQEQIGKNQSWTTIQKNYWKSQGYSSTPKGPDGYPMELNHIYGRYGSKINMFVETTHTQHMQFHQMYGYGRGNGGFNMYYPFKNIWEWLQWL